MSWSDGPLDCCCIGVVVRGEVDDRASLLRMMWIGGTEEQSRLVVDWKNEIELEHSYYQMRVGYRSCAVWRVAIEIARWLYVVCIWTLE